VVGSSGAFNLLALMPVGGTGIGVPAPGTGRNYTLPADTFA